MVSSLTAEYKIIMTFKTTEKQSYERMEFKTAETNDDLGKEDREEQTSL